MKWINCLPLLLCLNVKEVKGQQLRVGDTLKRTLLNAFNVGGNTITIPASNGKYTLIDFWASNCLSCIQGFDKMHRLQAAFDSALQVTMVNSYAKDSLGKVTKLFAGVQERTGLRFTLPYLLQDTLLVQHFPYTYLPHCVWISPAGRIDAITTPEELTDQHVRSWLTGNLPSMEMKNDVLRFDGNAAPVTMADTNSAVLFRSVISNRKKELGTAIGSKMDDAGLVTHFYMINVNLRSLYGYAYPALNRIPFRQVNIDPAVQHFFSGPAGTPLLYSYEYSGWPLPQQAVPAIVRQALEQCFDMAPVIKKLSAPCYVISANSLSAKLKSHGGEPLTEWDTLSLHPGVRNQPLSELLAMISGKLELPLLDESGLAYRVDIDLPRGWQRYPFKQLQAWLLQHGLVLTQTTRTLPVAIFQPVKSKPNIIHQNN